MANHKNTDAGLLFLNSLKIRPSNNSLPLEKQMLKVADRAYVKALLGKIDARAEGDTNDEASFYSLKNHSLETSMTLTGAFDSDILRNACNWIASHKEFFQGSILEIGCDCGIMTCFLAEQFPASQIVAIDRCVEAIENAKKLAQKRNITNVSFICGDVRNVRETFDTVFSMRTMHENIDAHEKEDLTFGYIELADVYCNALDSYARSIQTVLKKGGALVSFERISRDPLFLGWIKALCKNKIVLRPESYEKATCFERDAKSDFQVFAAHHTGEDNVNALDLYCSSCAKYLNFSLPQYNGWDAKLVYDIKRGNLIEGYLVEDSSLHTRSIVAVSQHKHDPTCIILHRNNEGGVLTMFYDISQKNMLIQMMQDMITPAKILPNFKVTRL